MAHFALVVPAEAGHLLPMGALGTALMERGHRVTLVAIERAAPIARRLGLDHRVLPADGLLIPRSLVGWLGAKSGKESVLDWFLWYSEALLQGLPRILEDLAVDGVLVDQVLPAGAAVTERARVPFVTVCSAIAWNQEPGIPPYFTDSQYREGWRQRLRNRIGHAGGRAFFGPMVKHINRYRRAWHLRRYRDVSDSFSVLAQISQLCPELDFPRHRLPEVFHYVGSLATERPAVAESPFPWDRLDDRPLIYVSLGTIAYDRNIPVLRKVLEALTGLDVQLVLGLGLWDAKTFAVPDRLGRLPANAIVVDFAPQLALLERASLMVTHGGLNSVLEALIRGVPLVVLPRDADQPGVATRVQYAGAGLAASFAAAGAGELRAKIAQVLGTDSFRRRALALGTQLQQAGGAKRAAELAELALTTGQPVRR